MTHQRSGFFKREKLDQTIVDKIEQGQHFPQLVFLVDGSVVREMKIFHCLIEAVSARQLHQLVVAEISVCIMGI